MKLAQEFGGHATCFRVNSDDPLKLAMQRFSLLKNNPLTAPLEIIQERLRKAFDPHGVFNTGRLP
jgi:glycolate oxidase FAD binding subunit